MNRTTHRLLVGLGLLFLFAVGFGARYAVLKANMDAYDGDLPFTLESALQFRATQLIYDGHGLPARDTMIQYPEGVDTFRTDTVMAEYVYATLARVLPSSMPLADRVRLITLAWFCLTIPLIAWWVAVWTRSRSAGAVAALFYAVSLAAVIRSTGLEISRENFALPFLIAHLAFDMTARRSLTPGGRLRAALGSGACLGLALAAWDMIQFYVVLWTLTFFVRSLKGTLPSDPVEQRRWLIPAGALILTSLLSPYHRSHGFVVSPVMLLVYGVVVQLVAGRVWSVSPWLRAALACAPLLVAALIPQTYGENYGHFTELLAAKVRFFNVKPIDPVLLTFNQRIMWVPALDSATWSLTWLLFPAIVSLVLVGIGIALLPALVRRAKSADTEDTDNLQYIFFFCSSLITYVLFVRFHVYVAIFAAAWMGWLWAWSCRRSAWSMCWVCPLVFVGLIAESAHVLTDPGRWGRPNVYYGEVRELAEWLRVNVAPDPVLANFGVSAPILAYGGCPIILHPKFEKRTIRDRVQAYGETLFRESEERFRDWADEHGASFYVYAVGEFATQHPELQMRYFVNALEPPENAAARVFEYAPHEASYFEYLWGNRKYRVFRVISREDERQADQLAIFARRALETGDLDRAEELAWAALALFPAQYPAREVIRHVASLREQGFTYEPVDEPLEGEAPAEPDDRVGWE